MKASHKAWLATKMRANVIIAVWVLLIVGGLLRFYLWPPATPVSTTWLATRKLPANHQLTDDDLRESGSPGKGAGLPPLETLVGLHLKSEKNAGDKVERNDLAHAPMNLAEPGQVSFIIPLNEKETSLYFLIKSGSQVILCIDQSQSVAPNEKRPPGGKAGDCFHKPLEVIAVHRKTSEVPGDWALLRAGEEDKAALHRFVSAEKKSLLLIGRK